MMKYFKGKKNYEIPILKYVKSSTFYTHFVDISYLNKLI